MLAVHHKKAMGRVPFRAFFALLISEEHISKSNSFLISVSLRKQISSKSEVLLL